MCLEPSLCPDRHREFARANKFQSQKISAESSLQAVLLRLAPHFPASSCCSNCGKEASHYMTYLTALPRTLGEVPKKEEVRFPEKADTLGKNTLNIPSNKPEWLSSHTEKRLGCCPKGKQRTGSTRFLPLKNLPYPILSGIQNICIEEWPSPSVHFEYILVH